MRSLLGRVLLNKNSTKDEFFLVIMDETELQVKDLM